MPPSVVLKVNGKEMSTWTRARITRGIEQISGSFELEYTENPGGAMTRFLPIRQGDQCSVEIAGQPMITGAVDKKTMSFGSTSHTISVSGRDATAALVDNAAGVNQPLTAQELLRVQEYSTLSPGAVLVSGGTNLATGKKHKLGPWEYSKPNVLDVISTLCKPYGINVFALDVPKAAIPRGTRFTVDPGEAIFESIEKLCRLAGVLPVSDGDGGLVLTRAGTERVKTVLVEGKNILSASVDTDASSRFFRYIVLGQNRGTDEAYGPSVVSIRGEALDLGCKRQERVKIIRHDGILTPAQAGLLAQWNATVAAARSVTLTVQVQGWLMADGNPWPINTLVGVEAESLEFPGGDLLICQTVFSLDDQSGTTTTLTLRRPDAFLPEPVTRPASGWPELANGVDLKKLKADAAQEQRLKSEAKHG